MNKTKWRFETKQLHVGQESPDSATSARSVPIYQTTSYVFKDAQQAEDRFALKDSGNIYGRLTNTTQSVFEERICALENGYAALAVASGAAAITYTILNLTRAGDNIVSSNAIYGGTYNLLSYTLKDYGVSAKFVNPSVEEFKKAIDENTKALYIETIGNPNANLIDYEKIAELAHEHKIPLVVDNTAASPYLFRPIDHGADIVVHSATKFIGGHGSSLGGVIIDSGKFDWQASNKFPNLVEPSESYHGISFAKDVKQAAFVTRIRAVLLRDTGATIAPLNAFLFIQGLETLSLRIERHISNTLKVVEFLSNHSVVEKVNHPSLSTHPDNDLYKKYFELGVGSIFTFNIVGNKEDAYKFIDSLEIFSLLANIADAKSLVIHPLTTTHSQLSKEEAKLQGIYENTIRLSIGLENINDILEDLSNALASINK